MKFTLAGKVPVITGSLPVRGAWIEIPAHFRALSGKPSLPVRGAWIEIRNI